MRTTAMYGLGIAAAAALLTTCILVFLARRKKPAALSALLTFLAGAAIGHAAAGPILFFAYLNSTELPGFQLGGRYYGGSLLLVAATSVVATILVFFVCRRLEARR